MPRYASLDNHTLNEKIDSLRTQVEAELDELEARFEDLYNVMHKMKKELEVKKKPAVKNKAKKVAHAKA
jgi:hypothetical protein